MVWQRRAATDCARGQLHGVCLGGTRRPCTQHARRDHSYMRAQLAIRRWRWCRDHGMRGASPLGVSGTCIRQGCGRPCRCSVVCSGMSKMGCCSWHAIRRHIVCHPRHLSLSWPCITVIQVHLAPLAVPDKHCSKNAKRLEVEVIIYFIFPFRYTSFHKCTSVAHSPLAGEVWTTRVQGGPTRLRPGFG